jgi:tRNA(His) guanylyltransferase
MISLRDRIMSYERNYDLRIMSKVPVVIVLNGRSFRKITSLLEKPFSLPLIEAFAGTSIKLMQEIDGAMFAYSFNDEIVIIARNDQTIDTTAWFDNKIQKICSATASIATSEFNRLTKLSDLQIIGDPTFTSTVFAVQALRKQSMFSYPNRMRQSIQQFQWRVCMSWGRSLISLQSNRH